MEIWKDIKGWEGYYKVSNLGRVKSLNRSVKNNHSYVKIKGKILKQQLTKQGYKRVTLSLNQKSKTYMVHRLVAISFIPNVDEKPIINHKDENKINNNLSNIEWCTFKYNTNYGTCVKRRTKKLINGKCSKIVYQYLMGKLIKKWESASECGRNGYSQSHVSSCCRGERMTHKGFNWSYEKI